MTQKKQVCCNQCGRPLLPIEEDALVVKQEWGYFSKKDLQVHEFALCEQCYDQMVEKFAMPITISDKREVLS